MCATEHVCDWDDRAKGLFWGDSLVPLKALFCSPRDILILGKSLQGTLPSHPEGVTF